MKRLALVALMAIFPMAAIGGYVWFRVDVQTRAYLMIMWNIGGWKELALVAYLMFVVVGVVTMEAFREDDSR